MATVYLFCLAFGFAFTALGAVLGQAFGAAHGHDVGAGHDADFGAGGDVDADLDLRGSGTGHPHHAGSLHLPLFSPTVLSFFLASFGGMGLLFSRLFGADRVALHLPLALVGASGLGLAAAYGLYKLTSALEKNRVARVADALTSLAEVSVSVPKAGMGAIAYVSAGTRQVLPARSVDGRDHRQGAPVRVVRVVDGVAFIADGHVVGEGTPLESSRAGTDHPLMQHERH